MGTAIRFQNGSINSVTTVDLLQSPQSGKVLLLGENASGFVLAIHSNISGEVFRGHYIDSEKANEVKALMSSYSNFMAIYEDYLWK